MKSAAIILAAGKGTRMNSEVPKQFMELCGRMVLYYSVCAFEKSNVDEIVLVTNEQSIDFIMEEVVRKYGFDKVSACVAGGRERCDSVLCGIGATTADYVLIHDGARPLIDTDTINRSLELCYSKEAVVVGVKSKDTVKVTDDEGRIISTPVRSNVWIAQTPQVFRRELILKAYDMRPPSYVPTDDAMLVADTTGTSAVMYEGSYDNLKITTPRDIVIAEEILKRRG